VDRTVEAKNKALSLESLRHASTSVTMRPREFWAPHYSTQRAHAPGCEGLFDLIKSLPPTLTYEPGNDCGRRNVVIVHGTIFELRPSCELDARHSPHRRTGSRRAMGCNSGRGCQQESKSGRNVWPTFGGEYMKKVAYLVLAAGLLTTACAPRTRLRGTGARRHCAVYACSTNPSKAI